MKGERSLREQVDLAEAAGQAIREIRLRTGMNQTDFAEAAEIPGATPGARQEALSQRETGEQLLRLDEIRGIESAGGVRKGTIVRRLDLVGPDDEWSTEEAILADPSLSDRGDRETLLTVYKRMAGTRQSGGSGVG